MSKYILKGGNYMHSIHDYVRLIADSMAVELSQEKINRIANWLVKSEKYKEMLHELEDMIQAEKKVKWRRK